jgi:hypothetical protein
MVEPSGMELTMKTSSNWWFAALAFFSLGGLGSGGCGAGSYYPEQRSGKIVIAWTVNGLPASTDACAGVDHMDMTFQDSSGAQLTVSPIPCTLTRFRYENLPLGNAALRIRAYRGSGDSCPLGEGIVRLRVTETPPETPSPVVPVQIYGNCQP